jgi:hypothetical protein
VQRNPSSARIFVTAFALAAFLFVAHAARADVVSFDGEVQRGDSFVHRFSHNDITYEFRLASVSHGWLIWIGDPALRDLNYVTVATPPFRGVNPTRIEGWRFRNADNTGANEPGPGNVNAPQKKRWFAFTPDATSHRAAARVLEILLWPDRSNAADLEAAKELFEQILKTEGLLHIGAMETGNSAANERAWIERMAFSVMIDLPD